MGYRRLPLLLLLAGWHLDRTSAEVHLGILVWHLWFFSSPQKTEKVFLSLWGQWF